MGRPPGSKNGGKKAAANGANVTPIRPAAQRKQAAAVTAPPAKKNGPTPSQNSEWLAEFTRLKTESRSVAGNIAALGARVKSGGGDWKNLKKIHDLLKLDPDEARAELDGLITLAAQNDIKVTWMGDQAAFTEIIEANQPPAKNTTGSRDLAAARAHSDGFNSGRNGGVPHDNPFAHAPGSQEYVSWHDGRDEGAKAAAARKEGRASAPAQSPAEASSPTEGEAPVDAPIF